jgi:hypothetical protein
MAIDTENKRRSVIGILPIPDDEALTESDRKQVAWIYNGLPFIEPEGLTLKEREFALLLEARELNLTLPNRPFNLTIPNRIPSMPISKRVINNSPFEIGVDEIAPYTLTIPTSWGTATNPVVTVKNAQGASLSGISSSVSVSNNVISFTLDGTAMTINNDFRVEFKFDVTGGALEVYGIWQSRL